MSTAALNALLSKIQSACSTGAPLTSLVAELRGLWREADEEFAAEAPGGPGFRAALLAKWSCWTLWQWLQELDGAVPAALRAELVRTGAWTMRDAVHSSWVKVVRRGHECGDDRYLEHTLVDLLDGLEAADLPAFRVAVAALGRPDLGYLALRLVRRLVAAGSVEEALAARSLATRSLYTALCLEVVAPLLADDVREPEIEAAWRLAAQEMGDSDEQRAYRSTDWARLIALSAPHRRRHRVLELEALVRRIPAPLREMCQDHDDLNEVVAQAWADLGEGDRAHEWADLSPLPADDEQEEQEVDEPAHRSDEDAEEPAEDPSEDPPELRSPEQCRQSALEQLQAARASAAPTAQIDALLFELSLPTRLVDGPACLAALVGASRAALAGMLATAGRWAQLAILARSEWGWPYLMSRLLAGDVLPGLSEAELRAACQVNDAAGLAESLLLHPPDARRLWDALEPSERAQLLPQLLRPPLDTAGWVQTIAAWAAEEQAAARDRGAREASDDAQSRALADEHALAAARRIDCDQYRWEAVLRIGLARGRGDAVQEALMGMSVRYDPAISLFPGARQAVKAGFAAEVRAVAGAQRHPTVRIGLLAELETGAGAELERELQQLIERGGPIEDAALGRAWPRIGAAAQASLWGHAFSEAQRESVPAFSWDTTGALAATAALHSGEALALVTWVTRLR